MKIILSILATVLLFSSICYSVPVKNVNSAQTLPKPELKSASIKDADHATVEWYPVPLSEDKSILGYKFKMWEMEFRNITTSHEENGKLVNTTNWGPVRLSKEPVMEVILPATVSQVTFAPKLFQYYEVVVQVFNSDGDGPESDHKIAEFMKINVPVIHRTK